MYRLAVLAIVSCGSVATPPPEGRAVVRGPVRYFDPGWCGTRPWHRAVHSYDDITPITVAADTLADARRPANPTWERGAIGWLGNNTAYTYASARVRGEVAELVSAVHRCEETALGCTKHHSGQWGGDVFAKVTVPVGTCIHYLISLDGGYVLGTSAGTFAVDKTHTPARVSAPELEYVAELGNSQAVLQETAGPLWRITWDAAAPAPALARVAAVKARTLAFHASNDDAYVFTADALITLDSTTLVEKWRIPGEVHAVLIPEDGTEAAFVRIDRSNPDQQLVVLEVRSQVRRVPGAVVRSRVVYDAPAIADADLRLLETPEQATYEVLVARR